MCCKSAHFSSSGQLADYDFRNLGHVGDKVLFLFIVLSLHVKHDGTFRCLVTVVHYGKGKSLGLLFK